MTLPMLVQMNVKIESRYLQLIQQIASTRGESTADFVRMSLKKELAQLGFLSQKECKALGFLN